MLHQLYPPRLKKLRNNQQKQLFSITVCAKRSWRNISLTIYWQRFSHTNRTSIHAGDVQLSTWRKAFPRLFNSWHAPRSTLFVLLFFFYWSTFYNISVDVCFSKNDQKCWDQNFTSMLPTQTTPKYTHLNM